MSQSIPQIYKALADESRLRILHMLSFGSFNVQEITALLGGSQPTVSHHLKVLSSVNLLQSRKEGTWIYYSPPQEPNDSLARNVNNSFLSLLKSDLGNGSSSIFKRDSLAITKLLAKRRDDGKRFFDSVAKEWRNIRDAVSASIPGKGPFLEILASRIPAEGNFLELGCGSGSLLEKLLPRAGETIGVDYSEAMLEEARAILGEKAAEAELRLGYLEHLPVENDFADCIAAYMVFHHLASPFDALRDACRTLKPGGTLLIVDLLRHDEEYMRSRMGDLWLGFDPEEFRQWLKDAGFSESSFELLGEKKDVFIITAKRSRV